MCHCTMYLKFLIAYQKTEKKKEKEKRKNGKDTYR